MDPHISMSPAELLKWALLVIAVDAIGLWQLWKQWN